MRSTLYSVITATVTVLSILSCTKEGIRTAQPEDGPFEVSITALLGEFEPETKSAVSPCIRMKWNTTTTEADKDSVWVYGSISGTMKKLGCLKATSTEENPYTATLSGSISSVPSDKYLYLVHCHAGTYSEPSLSSGSMTFDMSAVEQSSDAVPFIVYSVLSISKTSLTALNAKFSFATSMIKFNLTGLYAGASLAKATVTNVNKNCTLSFSGGTVTVTSAPASPTSEDLGTFTKNLSATANSDGCSSFYLGIPALSAKADRQLTVTVTTDDIIVGGGEFFKSGVISGSQADGRYGNTICGLYSKGLFSVSTTKKVKFSRGNLYYDGSSWNFEANQYDYRTYQNLNSCIDGTKSDNGTPEGNWGLFGWVGVSGGLASDSGKYGMSTSYYDADYGKSSSGTSSSDTLKADWAKITTLPQITGRKWMTLTKDEWVYLLNTRKVTVASEEKTSYGQGTVNGVNGLIILPDDWDGSVCGGFTYGTSKWSNTFSDTPPTTWDAMENAGCVFLPAAGSRDGAELLNPGSSGCYYSASSDDYRFAYSLDFYQNTVDADYGPGEYIYRRNGRSVRLVSVSTE